MVSGSPRVSFDPSPGWGVVLMLAGLSLLGAVAWVLFNPRLFVALVCGGIGEHGRSRPKGERLASGQIHHEFLALGLRRGAVGRVSPSASSGRP